jgi:hypothetical protein
MEVMKDLALPVLTVINSLKILAFSNSITWIGNKNEKQNIPHLQISFKIQ